MRMKYAMGVIGVLALNGDALAQFPGQPGFGSNSGLMPNIYNPQSQPLSPYLNMFRGANNPAANYYFGTRPGTVGGMGGMMGGGAPNIAMGGTRGLFFPQVASGPEPLDLPEADPASHTALPPAGHPVFFNNTMGYFPSPFGMNRGGPGMGNNRPGGAPRR